MLLWQQSIFASTISRAVKTANLNRETLRSGRGNQKAEQLDKVSVSVGLFFFPDLLSFLTAACNFTNVYMWKDPFIDVCKTFAMIFQAKSTWVSTVEGPSMKGWGVSLSHLQGIRLKPMPFLCVLLHLKEAQVPLQVTFQPTDALKWVLSSNILCFYCTLFSLARCEPTVVIFSKILLWLLHVENENKLDRNEYLVELYSDLLSLSVMKRYRSRFITGIIIAHPCAAQLSL